MRELHIPDGPANGGDGGSGGNVWIQAVVGQTSLHKLARQGIIKAGRGTGGQGKSQGGKRGEDVLIQVPPGTVIREVWRSDPTTEEEERLHTMGTRLEEDDGVAGRRQREKANRWLLYPGNTPSENENTELPKPLPPRRTNMHALQPTNPINLDLSHAMEKPMLLAAGAAGGLGNPHFVKRDTPKPKFASKGELGIRLKLELELKLLADVGLVGLPNAGKSTLLRSISNSRTRIGDWAFTTLSPNIGTVVIDNNEGRPVVESETPDGDRRTNFTVADIPGLVEDAHQDKGLGLGFLRHVERARMLAFVIDLSAGDAILALQNLWKEVGEYEKLRNKELNEETVKSVGPIGWKGFGVQAAQAAEADEDNEEHLIIHPEPGRALEPLKLPPISSKPWFVVATKADKPETQETFIALRAYLQGVQEGNVAHPSGKGNGWRASIAAIPVSAIKRQGVDKITQWVVTLLDSHTPR